MAVRLRTINGMRIALDAAETDSVRGDIDLDDDDVHALIVKFIRDFQREGFEININYDAEWKVMDSQTTKDNYLDFKNTSKKVKSLY